MITNETAAGKEIIFEKSDFGELFTDITIGHLKIFYSNTEIEIRKKVYEYPTQLHNQYETVYKDFLRKKEL